MNKRTYSQLMSIIFSLSKADNVGINEIKWLRKEMKNWLVSIFKI